MRLEQETVSFLIFICLGIVFGIIFDFFRALRKVKKRNNLVVSIQDITYFIIIGVLLSIVLYVYVKDNLRVYLIISTIFGIILYTSIVGNRIVKVFTKILQLNSQIIQFIFLPLDIFRQIFSKQIKKIKKYADNCCKRILYMINFKCIKFKPKNKKLITKEGKVCQELVVRYKSKRKLKLIL